MFDLQIMNNELSARERTVLSSLVQHPSSPDVEIASTVGVKHSTFATIKKRLIQQKYYCKFYIPNIKAMGAEILNFDLRTVSSCCTGDKHTTRKISDTFGFLREMPNVILSLVESNLSLVSSFSKNYTDLATNMMKFDNFAYREQVKFSSHYKLNFPVLLSEFPRVFDFSRSLQVYLEGEAPTAPLEFAFPTIEEDLNITKLGWQVFLSFLKNPGSSPRQVANELGKPRTSTTRWLRTFVQNGLFTPRILPNLAKIGFKVCLITHIAVMSTKKTELDKAIAVIDDTLTPTILVRSAHDIIFLSVFPSFTTAHQAERVFISRMNLENLSFDLAFRYFLSLPHTAFINRLNDSLVPLVNYLGINDGKPKLTLD